MEKLKKIGLDLLGDIRAWVVSSVLAFLVGAAYIWLWAPVGAEVVLSTSISYCQTGNLARIIESNAIPVRLTNGADRLFICDNHRFQSESETLPRDIAAFYPSCLRFKTEPRRQLILKQSNPAVCRALFEIQSAGEVVATPTTYEQGVNLCLGNLGRAMRDVPLPDTMSGPRKCTDEELESFGFL